MNSDSKEIFGCFVLMAFLVAIGAAFAGIATMLYNSIVVPTFGFPPLTFFQMWGIIILINLVFGGLRASTSKK